MTDEETADVTAVPMGEQTKAPEPEQATATGDKTATDTTTVGGVTLDGTQFPLAITLLSSIILLIATTTATSKISGQRDSYEKYAISVSCVSLITSFLSLLMHHFTEEFYDKIKKPVGFTSFLWSLIGACFLTFNSPFVTTSNGYFAAWATVYGCATSMGTNTCSLESKTKGLGAIMGHLASSIVTLIACIPEIESRTEFSQVRSNAIYALSLSCFSIVVMSTLMMMDGKGTRIGGKVNLGLMSFLALGWLIAACLVTFDGPFLMTGNGYFASWTAFLTAGSAAFAAYKAK